MKCTTILLIATLLIGGTQACTEVEECGDQAFDSLDLEPYNGQEGDTVDYQVISGADYINILGLVKE